VVYVQFHHEKTELNQGEIGRLRDLWMKDKKNLVALLGFLETLLPPVEHVDRVTHL
jgi:hypothetical protein